MLKVNINGKIGKRRFFLEASKLERFAAFLAGSLLVSLLFTMLYGSLIF